MFGRQSYVELRHKRSKPQSEVISPELLILYQTSFFRNYSKLQRGQTYADDCTIMMSGLVIRGICGRLNTYYLAELTTWTTEIRVQLNVQVERHIIPTMNKRVQEVQSKHIYL